MKTLLTVKFLEMYINRRIVKKDDYNYFRVDYETIECNIKIIKIQSNSSISNNNEICFG